MTWEGLRAAIDRDPRGVAAVRDVARRIDISWPYLARSIEVESAWNPAARSSAGCTGLIQWCDPQPIYGVSREQIAGMSMAEQAPMIERWYQGRHGLPDRDVYLAIAWPDGIGGADDEELSPVGSPAWKANPGWRARGNGPITVGAIRRFAGDPPPDMPEVPETAPGDVGPVTTAAAAVSFGGVALVLGGLLARAARRRRWRR